MVLRGGNASFNGGSGSSGDGGGAGNPGGRGDSNSYWGKSGGNGTGGLIIIYAKSFTNNQNIMANGVNGGNAEFEPGGGSRRWKYKYIL